MSIDLKVSPGKFSTGIRYCRQNAPKMEDYDLVCKVNDSEYLRQTSAIIKFMRQSIQLCTVLVLGVSCRQTENIGEIAKDYLLDDLGIYVELPPSGEMAGSYYTLDNTIYTIGKTITFDYWIIRHGDTLKISAPPNVPPGSDFQRIWDFVPAGKDDPNKIETISISVLDGISNDQQTMIKYNYQLHAEPEREPFSSTSGVIENRMNVWMHPHRDKYFMILELNPFPYIQKPYEAGNRWTWSLGIGDHWADDRWKRWSNSIRNNYEYEIIGEEEIETREGEMMCWVVQGTATSEIGATGLLAYFSERYGFVKLDYVNIDKSRLIIEVKEIR